MPGAKDSHSYMEYLARRGVHCWTFDHRGFGGSFKPAEGSLFTSRVRARDLLAVAAMVRRDSASPLTLAGLSMGCATVAAALERDPKIAERVVLIGPSGWRRLGTPEAKADWRASVEKSGQRRSYYSATDFPSLEKRLWVGEEARVDRAAFEHFEPTIRVPVLAVRGGDDTLATDEDLAAVRKLVDPSLLATRVFAGRVHDLHLYNVREDVFATLHDFVKP